jgi:hypothetical protein
MREPFGYGTVAAAIDCSASFRHLLAQSRRDAGRISVSHLFSLRRFGAAGQSRKITVWYRLVRDQAVVLNSFGQATTDEDGSENIGPAQRCRKWVRATSSVAGASATPDFGQECIPVPKSRAMQKRAFEWCRGPRLYRASQCSAAISAKPIISPISIQPPWRPAKIQCEPITSPSASQSTCWTISRKFPRSEMWDLVVSNPSHFDQYEGDVRTHGPNWRIDRGFFASISDHLT